jgi:hypothetical protein
MALWRLSRSLTKFVLPEVNPERPSPECHADKTWRRGILDARYVAVRKLTKSSGESRYGRIVFGV